MLGKGFEPHLQLGANPLKNYYCACACCVCVCMYVPVWRSKNNSVISSLLPPCGVGIKLIPKCLYLPYLLSQLRGPCLDFFCCCCFKKKYKVETEIENWIQKYDMEMGEKQVGAGGVCVSF